MTHTLLFHGLEYWRRNAPDRLAFAIDDESCSLTYGELGQWSDGIAQRLRQLGVQPGDRVGLTGELCLDAIAAVIAVWKVGGILNPYNVAYTDKDLHELVRRSSPRLVIADMTQASRLDGVPVLPFAELAAHRGGASGFQPVELDAESPAMIVYTSGSTGLPKGVIIAHGRQLLKMMEMAMAEPSLRAGSSSLGAMPIHTFTTIWQISFTTTLGATAYLMRTFDPERALKMLVDHRITSFGGISMMFDRVARTPGFAEADLSSVESAQGGGMRLSHGTFDAWREKGIVVRQIYGLTEIGGTGLLASRAEALARPDSCGRGLIFSSLRVLRQDGSEAAPNEPGDILLRSPAMMLGYWGDPDNTAAAVSDDWMRTGDVGIVDEEGYFTFMDRRKDVIDRPEGMIPPSEVEIAIAQLPAVIEVAVAGTDTVAGRPSHCAWIYATAPVTEREVLDHCAALLPGYKVPTFVKIAASPLPRMMSGKIDRFQLLRDHAPVDA